MVSVHYYRDLCGLEISLTLIEQQERVLLKNPSNTDRSNLTEMYKCGSVCNLMHVHTHVHVHAQVIIDNNYWKYVVEETYLGIISIKPLVLVAKVTSVVSTISFHVRHVYDHTSQLVALAVSHSQSRFLLSNTHDYEILYWYV